MAKKYQITTSLNTSSFDSAIAKSDALMKRSEQNAIKMANAMEKAIGKIATAQARMGAAMASATSSL